MIGSPFARLIAASVVLLALGAADVRAQGTLSTQGLGFPPGQLSVQARTMGGSIGESDPLSALNPAAIGVLTNAIVMMQAEPEYRELRIGSRTERTSVARFPLFLGALPLGSRWSVSLSASTLFDRTWETTTRDSQLVAGEQIRFTRNQLSDGSIADLRLAFAFAPTTWLKVGVGAHALSGRDMLRSETSFDDTTRFAALIQGTTVSFGGNAVSVGAHSTFPRKGIVSASYRLGGRLEAHEGSTVVGRGFAPDRFGASFVYLGITGTTIAVRAARDKWSRLEGIAPTLNIHEGWDIGVGADVRGPSYQASSIGLRIGARWRTLPFSANTTPVRERTWSGGVAFPLARGGAELNLGVLRAIRDGGADASEHAWTISTGFAVRP